MWPSATASSAARSTRRIDGALTEDEFKPLRLMNGLYLQLHAYMLRVAIPYGTLNSAPDATSWRMIADRWDKGYGHFTTRQNIQYNWPKLSDVPDMLDALAEVDMHAIQTSGNTIRNVTADHFAGAAADEIADPRPVAELIRQWSTDHPEFQFLPRKFKIAVTGSPNDRAVTQAHDIGLRIVRNENGEARLPSDRRRRPWPHADDRQGAPRFPAAGRSAALSRGRSSASTTCSAGATTNTRRASRSPCTNTASTTSAPVSKSVSQPSAPPSPASTEQLFERHQDRLRPAVL